MLGVKAFCWIRVEVADFWQQASESLQEAFPGPAASLATSPNLTQPQAKYMAPELSQALLVARNSMIWKYPLTTDCSHFAVTPHFGSF